MDFQVNLNLLGWFLACVLLESFIKFPVDSYYEPLSWFMIRVSIIVCLRWDFRNEIITSVVNAAAESFLYCREALKMPYTMNKKALLSELLWKNYEALKFVIHFLWRSCLTTTLWSWRVDIKPDKCRAQLHHQSSQ